MIYAAHPGDSTPPKGYNAIILPSYQNGQNNSEFFHCYCQLIFSKQFIACPHA